MPLICRIAIALAVTLRGSVGETEMECVGAASCKTYPVYKTNAHRTFVKLEGHSQTNNSAIEKSFGWQPHLHVTLYYPLQASSNAQVSEPTTNHLDDFSIIFSFSSFQSPQSTVDVYIGKWTQKLKFECLLISEWNTRLPADLLRLITFLSNSEA